MRHKHLGPVGDVVSERLGTRGTGEYLDGLAEQRLAGLSAGDQPGGP